MNISINQLRQLISDLGQEVNNMIYDLGANAKRIGHTEVSQLGGTIQYITDEFDYEEHLSIIQDKLDLLISYKNKLAKANSTTQLEDESMTIIDGINHNTEQRQLLKSLERALNQTSSRYRRDTQNGSSYYEVEELNFVKVNIEKTRDEIRSRINILEAKIDKANSSTLVEL